MKHLVIFLFLFVSACSPQCYHGIVQSKHHQPLIDEWKYSCELEINYDFMSESFKLEEECRNRHHYRPERWFIKMKRFDNEKVITRSLSEEDWRGVRVNEELMLGQCQAEVSE